MHLAGFSHVSLTVTDLDAARIFWTEVMGFEAVVEAPGLLIVVDAQVAIACVTHEAGDHGPFDERRVGLDHLSFDVETVDQLRAWEARLTGRGVPSAPIVESPFGSHLNVRGPENLAIELVVMRPEMREALFGGVHGES